MPRFIGHGTTILVGEYVKLRWVNARGQDFTPKLGLHAVYELVYVEPSSAPSVPTTKSIRTTEAATVALRIRWR